MQFTVDTRTATQFELTAVAELFHKLAAVAPERIFAFASVAENTAGNDSPDDSSAAVRYWHHPESGCVVVTKGDPTNQVDELACEIDHATYVKLQAQYAGNDAPTVIPEVPASATGSANPANVPAVPSATPAAGAGAVPAVPNDTKLDSAGFPWDARIHTANKAVIGDRTWRKKPGVDMALYAKVQGEWTASQAGGVPAIPNAAATGAIPDVPASATAPAVPTLSAADVLARCTEVQMSDMSKGAALYQAVVAGGVAGGPMALAGVTDPAVLAAVLAEVNKVAAA